MLQKYLKSVVRDLFTTFILMNVLVTDGSLVNILNDNIISVLVVEITLCTGELDSNSLEIMNAARCGISDIENPILRNKRYELYRLKWNSQHLTYRISKYTKKINRNLTEEEISRAFSAWTNVTDLVIEQTERPKADIIIRFERRIHGDQVPFDGPGQTLAHTFYPLPVERNRLSSFIHFDNAEKWTVRSKSGVNLYQIAVHEIGHSLGLKHSNVKDSVMWPKHQGYRANFTLHRDDISAIQKNYSVNIRGLSDIIITGFEKRDLSVKADRVCSFSLMNDWINVQRECCQEAKGINFDNPT